MRNDPNEENVTGSNQQSSPVDDLSKLSPDGYTSSSQGLGIWNMDEPNQDDDAIPGSQEQSTPWETRGANLGLALTSKWNLSYDVGTRILDAETDLFHGKEAMQAREQARQQYHSYLENVSNNLPSDDAGFTTNTLPSLLGGLADPLTIGAAKIGESGLKAVLPTAITAGLDYAKSAPVSEKIWKSAVKNTAVGIAGGAASSAGVAAATYGTDQQSSLGAYISNALQWGAFGSAHGILKPVAGEVFKNMKSKLFDNVSQESTSSINDPIVSRETANDATETAHAQALSGKTVNAETAFKADQNEAINSVEKKQQSWDNTPEDAKVNQSSPYQQLQDVVDQATQNKLDAEDRIKNVLSSMSDSYGGLSSESIAQETKATPLPAIFDTLKNIKDLPTMTKSTFEGIQDLRKTLMGNSYTFGPGGIVRDALNNIPYLVSPEDKEFVKSMHNQQSEIEALNGYDGSSLSEDNQALLSNRISALNEHISNGSPDIPLYSTHLDQLNTAIDDLAEASDNLSLARSNLDYKTADRNDVVGSADQTINHLQSDGGNITDPATTIPANELAEDHPYDVTPNTFDQMDSDLSRLKEQGILNDDDFSEVKAVDDAEKNDAGQQKFFDMIKTCLLRNS